TVLGQHLERELDAARPHIVEQRRLHCVAPPRWTVGPSSARTASSVARLLVTTGARSRRSRSAATSAARRFVHETSTASHEPGGTEETAKRMISRGSTSAIAKFSSIPMPALATTWKPRSPSDAAIALV